MPACPRCRMDVLEIDVKCNACGAAIGASGAHRMLGQVMLGHYELVDVLGQGGMSVVFKGRHKMTNQDVALKILPPELAAHSQVKSRFLEEAKALAALDHPNIVHLYNFGQENGYFVLAMQFVQGKTWERLIVESKQLDWKASCRISIDVLRALEYAHGRGIVHRDMKPSNVLVRAHDAMATVMDFGIAKMTTSTKLTATGQTMGTVRYMSPEQVRGQEVDLRTDLYSLGATLYESLVGDTPFDGATHFEIMTKHLSEVAKRPSQLGIEVPASVEEVLFRSLSKRADDRPENAREMRKILEAALREGDVGLVETQELNREVLGDVRKAVASARLATASDLADQLEPGSSSLTARRPKPRARSVWPWLALGVVVLGGGATAAIVATRPSTRYQPIVEIRGVTIREGLKLGDRLTVETDGVVPAAELGAAYQRALGALRTFAHTAQPGLVLADPVEIVVAVPAGALCEPTAYIDGRPPADCASVLAATAIGAKGSHRLMVSDERGKLAVALRAGVAQAVCDYQPVEGAAPDKDKRLREICEMTAAFASAPQ